MTKDVLVGQEYWDDAWREMPFYVAPENDQVRRWLDRHFRGRSGSCIELGCFPGRYLAAFGELGYELHGIDLTPRVDEELKAWFLRQGYKVGEIIRGDAFRHPFGRTFDVVCSFGLIEHFKDWPAWIRRHAELVAAGGFVVITTPNFRGWVQRGLHWVFDRENYLRHNIDAMVPDQWAAVAKDLGLEVVEHGYLGPFHFWVEPAQRSFPAKAAVKLMRMATPLLAQIPAAPGFCAPYCGLIARRPA